MRHDERIKTSDPAQQDPEKGYAVGVSLPLKQNDDGWLEWTESPRGTTVVFRVEEASDGRYHVVDLKLSGALSADRIRAVPLGRLEAAANSFFHEVGEFGGPKRRRKPAQARIAESLRENAVQGYPDSFYDAVATAYRSLVASSSRPIGELADANDVPVTTAQRWVREARRRGKLPPGRPGKSG